MPTGFGLRPGCESAGRATESLPVTRLPSTLHECWRSRDDLVDAEADDRIPRF